MKACAAAPAIFHKGRFRILDGVEAPTAKWLALWFVGWLGAAFGGRVPYSMENSRRILVVPSRAV
jgi:hypothetical protein